jgi:hypothetical protein
MKLVLLLLVFASFYPQNNQTPEQYKKSLQDIKARFSYNYDEFRNIGFYTPKTHKLWPSRSALYAYCNTEKNLFLVSHYFTSKWLFHEKVIVMIDTVKYYSPEVSGLSKSNKREVSGGFLYENVTYSGANDIIQAVAENYTKEIKVRFVGAEYNSDLTLSQKDKEAIRDTWNLLAVMDSIPHAKK